MNELAITVIGSDRLGIVADIAEAFAGLGANSTDSTMKRLRGHFAITPACTVHGAGRLGVVAAVTRVVVTARLAVRRHFGVDRRPARRQAQACPARYREASCD